MIAPISYEYRKLIENRNFSNSRSNAFLTSTKYCLKDLLSSLISNEYKLELHRKKFRGMLGFNARSIFEAISKYGSSFVSEIDVFLLIY